MKDGCYGIHAPDDDAEIERNLRGPDQGYSGQFKDDLSGQILTDSMVREARATELAFFHPQACLDQCAPRRSPEADREASHQRQMGRRQQRRRHGAELQVTIGGPATQGT